LQQASVLIERTGWGARGCSLGSRRVVPLGHSFDVESSP
jgi:hypothetical protein